MQVDPILNHSQVLAGLDNLRVAFPISVNLDKVLSQMFSVSLSAFTISKRKNPKWYEERYDYTTKGSAVSWGKHTDRITDKGHTLIVVFYHHVGWNGGRKNLVTINGLALSKLASNPFRNVPVRQILEAIRDHGGTITGFHCCLDITSNLVPFDKLMEQALPHNYRRYLRSPFVRDRAGVPRLPQLVGSSTIYYGKYSRNCCQVSAYDKRLDPNQEIWTEENALKFPYFRIELRFKGRTGRREGRRLFQVVALSAEDRAPLEKVITAMFKSKWVPINPTHTRPSNCKPQQWYLEMLDQATSLQ